jgi:hypothetical protein
MAGEAAHAEGETRRKYNVLEVMGGLVTCHGTKREEPHSSEYQSINSPSALPQLYLRIQIWMILLFLKTRVS